MNWPLARLTTTRRSNVTRASQAKGWRQVFIALICACCWILSPQFALSQAAAPQTSGQSAPLASEDAPESKTNVTSEAHPNDRSERQTVRKSRLNKTSQDLDLAEDEAESAEWQQLSNAVAKVQRETRGKALSVRKIQTRQGLLFRIKVLTRAGRVRVVQINAGSAALSAEAVK